MKLYDKDYVADDLLANAKITIKSNIFSASIFLDRIPLGSGGDTGEGDQQELFADIEVLQSGKHSISKEVNVDSKVFKPDPVEENNTVSKIWDMIIGKLPDMSFENKNESCGEKYCIKNGDPKSELIREINIRLAGFGGNVPTDEFTDQTEKMIKQFQRDYMKVPETGKICGNVLRAIDEFSNKFDVSETVWSDLDCSCTTKNTNTTSKLRVINELNNCKGWGDGTGKGTYKTGNAEKDHKYEYPGIHRSLLFGFKATLFYLSTHPTYKFRQISSGYRCRFKNYRTTNHQGKAIDIQFKDTGNISGALQANIPKLKTIRDDIFYKYLNSKTSWIDGTNNFCLEPIALLYRPNGKINDNYTYSWIHFDVREFEPIYLEDKYFCKNKSGLNGQSIIQLAKLSGFEKTCNCLSNKGGENKESTKSPFTGNCEDKFKKVAPIILRYEGGYVNDPDDSGGETNKGITIGTFQQYAREDLGLEPSSENLKKITDDQATTIYRKRYWEPKGFCKIEDDKVSLMIYDWTVTSGGGATKKVQELLINEFDQKITADGGIGPKTIEAINNVEDQNKLLKRIAEIRKEFYKDLAIKNGIPTKNYKFLDGWHNRVNDCLNLKL